MNTPAKQRGTAMSADEYVPDEDEMRDIYGDYYAYMRKEATAEFDRFLARVKREAAREALDGLAEHEDALHSRDPEAYAECKHVVISAQSYRETHYRIPEETP